MRCIRELQKIGFRTIRPYAMNAMRRPSPTLMMMGGISRYLACTPNEHEALDRQDRGGHHRERRLPVEGGGDDQPDRADELEDAEGHPSFPRQRTKGPDPLAYLVEHEDLHDARRSVQERGEDLQDPQQNVHRVPLCQKRDNWSSAIVRA